MEIGVGRREKRFTMLDWLLLAAIAGGVWYAVAVSDFSLTYKWNWKAIPQFFFRFDAVRQSWVPNLLVQGILATIRISVWSSALALPIGILMGMAIRSQSLYLRELARTYVELVRNTPPLVLIFIFYFFLGNQLMLLLQVDQWIAASSERTRNILEILFAPESQFSAFISALLTMAVYEGAYMAEIVRAGLDSVAKEQWEAADAIGLRRWPKYRHVILPQAFRTI